MQSIQIGQFKSELSSILEQIQNDGEKFVIEYGRSRKRLLCWYPIKKKGREGNLDS